MPTAAFPGERTMTDEALRDLHRRISAIMRDVRDEQPDHYYACVILAELSSVPFERVYEACAEL